jgi:uncharacterized repeat protein (TIGR01451 family)
MTASTPIAARTRRGAHRAVAAMTALVMGAALALAGASAAHAVAVAVSIQSTSPTTLPSGSSFTYQINLACAGTNSTTCNNTVVTIPLDDSIDMLSWTYSVSGGPAGFIQAWEVDEVNEQLVITLADTIPTGSSQSIILSVTPPNLVTPDGTSWSLLPTVTSDDPLTDDTTAPAPASGTATASVPLSVSKTSDRTFYTAGEPIVYTLRATCPATKPLGSVVAASMVVTDTLPDGLTFVSATPAPTSVDGVTGELRWEYADADSVPLACGGQAPDAASETISVTATVGSVGPDAGDDFAGYEVVPNTVNVTATPLGGGDESTGTGTRDVVMLGGDDPAIPGTTSLGKSSAAPLNRAPVGSPDRRATYPGRWLPNGDNSSRPASVLDAAPGTYTITPRVQYEGFEYELRDKVPCLDNLAGGVYTQSAGLCDNPAFHVLGVRLEHSGPQAPAGTYAPEYVRADGTGTFPMEFETSSGNWVGWVIPTGDITNVAEIIIPRDASQTERRTDTVRVYGFADDSTQDGQTLQNRATGTWYLGDATESVLERTSGPADIFILNAPQIGATKSMSNIGGATGTQASLSLSARLFTPGVPVADLVIADLLPVDTSLVTNPGTITAQLVRPGGSTLSYSAPALVIELMEDHLPGQQLLRVTLPVDELPAEAGQFTLTLSSLVVDKPSQPGVYTNTARSFYDSADLLSTCANGDFVPEDANDVRPDLAALPGNCAAQATFSTVTSSSGEFLLTKTVQGDYDDSPQSFPAVGRVQLSDGVADYAIRWVNTGAPTLTGVVLYDIFPFVGDTGVSGAQASEPRDSEFQPTLASVGAAPTDVTIAYSASTDPCRPEVHPAQDAATCVDDWTTDPSDLGGLESVSAIRLVSTANYQTGEGLELGFQMSVPTVSKDLVAWNSVAAFAQTTGGVVLLPTESPKVGITASDERFTLAKEVDIDDAEPGDTLTYTITVGNTGTVTSVPTEVRDTLPAGVTFVSADSGGEYDAATRTVTWSIPAMLRDDTLALTVVVTVNSLQSHDTMSNRAQLVNPAGYAPPIVANACVDSAEESCAITVVPVSDTALGVTGGGASTLALVAAALAIVLGIAAVVVARAQRRPHLAVRSDA